ncbi:MAG: DEAD/DEAH box helicase [Phycisphaerales bacterium]|nr:DEAD/DEAH box helicase [Phycisphaerales bacterium]
MTTIAPAGLFVLHTQWSAGALRLWAESAEAAASAGPGLAETEAKHSRPHPFSADADALAEVLRSRLGTLAPRDIGEFELLLPSADGVRPLPSDRLARHTMAGDGERPVAAGLSRFRVASATVPAHRVLGLLDALIEAEEAEGEGPEVLYGPGVVFCATAGAMVRHLLVQQRFVPMLSQDAKGGLHASWRPWLSDEATASRMGRLLRAMPPASRAAIDEFSHQPWPILEDMLWRVVDAECRKVMQREAMHDTIAGREASDPHVAWLKALLSERVPATAPPNVRQEMIKRVRNWIGRLEERGASALWRLCLRLNEPMDPAIIPEMQRPPESVGWSLSFHLQAVDAPEVMIDAADIWLLPADGVSIEGRRVEQPQELLLAELARASRLFKELDAALNEAEPVDIRLPTEKAYEFLREVRPILVEQGFGVLSPAWWESSGSRLGARLRIDSDSPPEPGEPGGGGTGAATPQLGLSTLVDYHWEIAVGDTTLTLREFEQLAAGGSPLVRIGGKWVEIRPEDVKNAVKFIRENPGGQMRIGEALRLAFASDTRETGLPIVGMEVGGWLSGLMGTDVSREGLPVVEQPAGFKGTLRPYQVRGVSWMSFLERFGFGVCLADDMGLGKTIQLLALLVHEREDREKRVAAGESLDLIGPTLLIAPTSVLGNWMYETSRFAPALVSMIHHGVERLTGDAFVEKATASDIVITTYALAHRDRELLDRVRWGRIVLDEAQYVKNPTAKQSQAVRGLIADKRIALTGTPVENRLSELWSIMEFLNPGYLGDPTNFRRRFSLPIERYHDKNKSEQLKGLVRPFILRRLKTDPQVVSDLPEKLESKEYCHLTGEQAELYENCVRRMLGDVERAEGIQRRGLVLSALIRLKQICNHPSQFLKDHDASTGRPPSATRSGKAIRLIEQLDEVLAESEQAIVFTQFRQMGHLLQQMLRHEFDRDVLFLHGGTPQKQREALIKAFQKGDGSSPILILSLKAGGVGLNLTAATHVFHYDRWWNPAVENQATDRAYRIGQTRTVVVHKYLVRGTLEERIDQMIEQKTELAENIIGSGERWLTELDTEDLRELLALRSDAVGDE